MHSRRLGTVPPFGPGQNWAGTMCLTEPHCGSDLGQMKTKAEKNDDDSYTITGTKIFISAGEHDMTDNIVHIVLARLPDAPAGTNGLITAMFALFFEGLGLIIYSR